LGLELSPFALIFALPGFAGFAVFVFGVVGGTVAMALGEDTLEADLGYSGHGVPEAWVLRFYNGRGLDGNGAHCGQCLQTPIAIPSRKAAKLEQATNMPARLIQVKR
jgi:hypothetical protein